MEKDSFKKTYIDFINDSPEPVVICITGKMAAGKNYVSSIFETAEFRILCGFNREFISLDADILVHKAIDSLSDEIARAFSREAAEKGISILTPEGKIDRRALGSLIFPEPELLKRQEDLVYPKVIQMTEDFIEENRHKNIILNATVLYKTPELLNKCSLIVFCDAPYLKRLFRAKKRDGMPFKKILERFETQKELSVEYEKSGIPVLRINNSGTKPQLVRKILRKLSTVRDN